MGALLGKNRVLNDNKWIFPIQEAVRQVVPPEYIDDTLEDVYDEDTATARAIEISAALSAAGGHRNNNDSSNKIEMAHVGGSSSQRQQPSTMVKSRAGKTTLKFYKYFADWLPRLKHGPAVGMLILNVLIPGLGTMVFASKWFSPEDFIVPTTKAQRGAIVCTCVLYGFMQFLLAPFIFGWLWSITTGILAIQQAHWVEISENYSSVIEQRLKEMLNERRETARQHGRLIHNQLYNNSGSLSDDGSTVAVADVSMLHQSGTTSIHQVHIINTTTATTNAVNGNRNDEDDDDAFFQPPHHPQPINLQKTFSAAENFRPKPANQQMTNSSVNRPKTPILAPKQHNNDVFPTDQPLSSPNVGVVTELWTTQDDNLRLGSAASRASSRKSRKSNLSLSLNRVSPAPTPAAKLSVSSSVGQDLIRSSSSEASTPSPLDAERNVMTGTPSGHKTVTFSRSVQERQSNSSAKAWELSKVPEPEPEPPLTVAKMYGDKDDDSSGDDVIIDLKTTTARNGPKSPSTATEAELLNVEDI